MKKFLTLVFLSCSSLFAFPSSLYWTVCTTDVVDPGKAAFDVSIYTHLFHPSDPRPLLTPDIGLTFGLMQLGDWKFEAGFDYFAGIRHPWFFNAKTGIGENKLFENSPSFSVGIFEVGTSGETNFNVVDVMIGKKLPNYLSGGQFFVGGFTASQSFGRDTAGYMIGYYKTFCPDTDCYGVDYSKWWLMADYNSGRNFNGGGGVGIAYFMNSKVSLITGPTWFTDASLNGNWKWTVQVFILFDAIRFI